MRTLLVAALAATLVLSSQTGLANTVNDADAAGDEYAVILSARLPTLVMDCEDQTIDLRGVGASSDGTMLRIYVAVTDLYGARECMDNGYESESRYSVGITPYEEGLIAVDDALAFDAIRRVDGSWESCIRLVTADDGESECMGGLAVFAATSSLYWQVPVSGTALMFDGSAEPYNMAGETASLYVSASSRTPEAPLITIRDTFVVDGFEM